MRPAVRFGAGVAAVIAVAAIAVGVAAEAASAADAACAPGTIVYTQDKPPALAVMQADLTWTRSTGLGVLVAVVDSGIDGNNAHLSGAIAGGIDMVGDGENPSGLSDVSGHGTAIAGEIAARPIAGSGVIGLAPDARLLSVRVFRGTDDESVRAGFGPTAEKVALGIRYAADSQAKIINVSLSEVDDTPVLREAVEYAAAKGSLVVASAGNAATTDQVSNTPRYPAAYPGSLAVTATNGSGVATNDSIHGPHVEIAAPGSQILTSATGAGDCLYASDTPSTSFATGYVSAAAALVAQAHPEETPAEWKYRLMATAVRADPDQRDDLLGWGVAQPFEAITLLPDATTRGPKSPFGDTGSSAVRPEVVTVKPSSGSSGFALTTGAMALVAIAGLTVLGTLAVIIAMRARRRDAAAPHDAAATGLGGLLDRPKND